MDPKENTYVLYHSPGESSYTFVPLNDGSKPATTPSGQPALAIDATEVWRVNARSWEIACLLRNEHLGWEPYKAQITGIADLKRLIPRDKFDMENFRLLRNLGLPTIEPILPQLLEWMQDYNWPVAQELAGFLSSLGASLAPHLERVLATDDGMWKYWLLEVVVAPMPRAEQQKLLPILRGFANSLTHDDRLHEADIAVHELLDQLDPR